MCKSKKILKDSVISILLKTSVITTNQSSLLSTILKIRVALILLPHCLSFLHISLFSSVSFVKQMTHFPMPPLLLICPVNFICVLLMVWMSDLLTHRDLNASVFFSILIFSTIFSLFPLLPVSSQLISLCPAMES